MLIAAVLLAQAALQAPCGTLDATLPAELAGWTRPAQRLAPGTAFDTLTRDPAAGTKPERPGRAARLMFIVKTPGSYRIALDQRGWIDVRPQGAAKPLSSTGHGHGPRCSTIRKLVAFDLEARTYHLELSGLERPRARVMLVAEQQGKDKQ